MEDVFDLPETNQENVVIKVISVSENSDSALRNMEKQIDGVNFIYFDAIENTENIHEILNDADMVFLIGATSYSKLNDIAEIAFELKILTLAIVTKPFEVNKNITQLLCHVDEGKTLNDVLLESVQGITGCVIHPGFINLDFSDVQKVLSGESRAIISVNSATGENRAREAVEKAMNSPLFREADLKNAPAIFVNISASEIGLAEFNEVGAVILEQVSESASVKIGTSIKSGLGEAMSIVIVFAGV